MNKLTHPLLPLLCSIAICLHAQKEKNLVAHGATPQIIADGFIFTEGPAVDNDGNVYFTDQPNDRIWKWTAHDGTLSLYKEKQGRANGLYIDKKGNLYSCADLDNELRIYDQHGNHNVLVNAFEGKKLNGPNDLWIAPSGGIYFTDPYYKRNYWTHRNDDKQIDGENVYFLTPDRKKLIQVASDLDKPNGIAGTPDGKYLYVADIQANKTYRYNILPDGQLSEKKLFAESGSDGMTLDAEGNVYLTGNGVTVFNPEGEQIAHIPIAANWTANLCFGGKERKTLIITACQFLYALKMNVAGVE
ncbi:MAG: SMP-30/gluconolactonase/LRE family protein [Tannerella sp.]|jgi:gluconolactonase|nr:SMP-30/gluconolactonase/LRE family protein [Tannerella sp.]